LGVHTRFFLRRYESSCQMILQRASPVATGITTVPLDLLTRKQQP